MAIKAKVKTVVKPKPIAVIQKQTVKDVQRTQRAINAQKRKLADAKVKEKLNKIQHQKKVDELTRKAQLNKIKAEAKLAKPKNVAKREDRAYRLEKLRAGERVQIAKYQHQWKNTLAGGVAASSNVNALTDSSGGAIQDQISKALGGIDKSSLPGDKPEAPDTSPKGEVTK